VDVHAHYFPERFVQSINEQGGPPGVSFDLSNPDEPIFNIGGGRIPIDVTYWDLPKRIVRMDTQGVTTHALSLTTPFVYWATPERGAALARIVNDSMIMVGIRRRAHCPGRIPPRRPPLRGRRACRPRPRRPAPQRGRSGCHCLSE
jgi:hypothetical protein